MSEARPGPLAGIKVLDLTTVVLGPLATQILGDLGAEVIKVESPDGDIMRYAGPARHREMGHVFLNLNRNKRSLVLDLKQPEAAPIMLALAAQSDVLMHNMRPQAMARLGFAWERLQQVNPRIGRILGPCLDRFFMCHNPNRAEPQGMNSWMQSPSRGPPPSPPSSSSRYRSQPASRCHQQGTSRGCVRSATSMAFC